MIAAMGGQSQEFLINTFTVDDGLSQSTVNAINQDAYGFLWISTGDGLTCYDGRTFEQYYSPLTVFGTGAGNRMRNSISDSYGNLWIGTDEGLLYLDRNRLVMKIPFPEITELRKKPCIPLFCTPDSVSILVVHDGILVVNIQTKHFRRVPIQDLIGNLKMHSPKMNERWFGLFPSGLVVAENTNGALKVTGFRPPNKDMDQITGIVVISPERYIISTVNGLYSFDKTTGKTTSLKEKISGFITENARFAGLLKDQAGDIWIGTLQQGIYIADENFSLKQRLMHNPNGTAEPFLINNLTTLFKDESGNIWFGTDGNGLGLITSKNDVFRRFDNKTNNDGDPISLFTRCFFEDDDQTLWVGTSFGGVNQWQRKSNTVSKWLLDKNTTFPSANDIYCIAPFQNSYLLLGTSGGVWLFNKELKTGTQLSMDGQINQINKAIQILNYGDDFLVLINNQARVLTLNQEKWNFNQSIFPDSAIINFLSINKSVILGFSVEGLYSLENNVITFNPYLFNDNQAMLKVNASFPISDTSFWLATGTGLALIHISGSISAFYGVREGLPNHYLYGILSDDNGHLWVSSNKGISKFNPVTEQYLNFGMESGLQSPEFNSGAYYKNERGEMFFGGINGFNYFYPDSIKQMNAPPKTFIRHIMVNDLLFLPDTSILAKKRLTLPYAQNTITFEYQAIDFSPQGPHAYMYFLEGHDKQWIQAGTITRARYSRLRPGRYLFRVKAIEALDNHDGSETSLVVIIRKPLWMTWPFIFALSSILVLIIVYSVQYIATRKAKRQITLLERQREISLVRRRIGSDLHDDIGSGLSRLAMMADTAKSLIGRNTPAEEKLNKMVTHTRQMIDQLRVIVWALNPQFDQLENLVAYIHQHISEFIEEFPVSFSIFIPDSIPEMQITPEFKRNVFYVIKEAVHNALKHSGSGDISLSIEIINDHFIAKVEDSGKGFDFSLVESAGNGLRFMEKRVKDLGGSFRITSSRDKGTLVELIIPV